ncbi:ClpP/crotonase-like domain-containing protein [Fimicolochytrium jonesii]|uniref:ClpP/crotonase-like domain-containing protein n=1 Tax=Fimicolochytrium jonesii TaxID=1396493 RepID=UPI0022FE551A|nr:ClpP/crotonase-like domain-containing protein [Fimicolochytrium jonesii]KAI8817074.1 ClpP/crotonase-like domain-containing protein [Fimicolochytrium jonesii]
MSAQPFTRLEYSVADGIATIAFNTPKSLNAIAKDFYYELPAALKRAEEDEKVVVTLITAYGRYFSSGQDVTEQPVELPPAQSDADATRAYYRRRFDGSVGRIALAMAAHPKVLVVGLNGPVVGVAAAMISHADLIYVSDTATLHAPFTALAISPEAGSSFMFVRRMGVAKAMEALLLSKKFTPHELVTCGFANAILPTTDFHATLRTALLATLANVSPASLRVTKALVRGAYGAEAERNIHEEVAALTERYSITRIARFLVSSITWDFTCPPLRNKRIDPFPSTSRFVSGAPQKVFAGLATQFGKKNKL